MLRYGTNNIVIGEGTFCSIACAKNKLRTCNHGDSDYFECLTLMNQKYGDDRNPNRNPKQKYYEPPIKRDITSMLTPIELREPVIPTYKVKKASRYKKSTNDIIKNEFFTGKCEPIMTAKNLCASK